MKFLTVLCAIALGLSACAGGPTGPEPQQTGGPALTPTSVLALPTLNVRTYAPTARPSNVPTLGVKADELRGAQVNFWYPAGGDLAKEYAAQIAEFNLNNLWGIQVVGRAFSGSTSLDEQLLGAIKAGQPPQAAAAPLEMLLDWQARQQILVPLDAYIRDSEWGLASQEPGDFFESYWQDEQIKGQRWGIPAGRNLQVLFYNQTWAEELGFRQPPGTAAEFRAQACAAAKANLASDLPDRSGTGGWILSNDPLALESWRRAFGGEALPTEDGRAYLFNSPSAVKAFSFLRKLSDDNCAWISRAASPYPYFAGRQALFYSGSLLDVAYQERAMSFAKSSDRWTVLPYPLDGAKRLVLFDGASYGLLRSTPQRQLAAWLFLHQLVLPRVQARLANAAGLLPPSRTALAMMGETGQAHPAWAAASAWQDLLQPAPRLASWRTARRVLQDAAWQIFSPATRLVGIPGVLAELDASLPDLLKARP